MRSEEEDSQFDCVVASEVVEHVANVPLFLRLLTSSVKVTEACCVASEATYSGHRHSTIPNTVFVYTTSEIKACRRH